MWGVMAKQLRALESPGAMARWVWGERVKQTPALDLVDAALVRAANTPDSRLIITMAPQEGKSQRVSRDYPLWYLRTHPRARVILGSYGQDLANRNSGQVRSAIRNQPALGMKLDPTTKAVNYWRLDNEVGGIRAVGVGGSATGFSADLIIIDDPVKSKAEADSETYRQRVWDWWQMELAGRLAPGASVVVIMTRWHDDDLVGRLVADAPGVWKVLNIEAQCESPEVDPLGRAAGEYMVSTRGRTPEQWAKRKREVGGVAWRAQFQGDPVGAAGDVFKREWFAERRWRMLPLQVDTATGAHWLSGFDRVWQSWDFTFKDTAGSDYVVGQLWAQRGADVYLVDQVRDRMDFPEQMRQLKHLTAKWPQAAVKLVEDKANGSAILSALAPRCQGSWPSCPPSPSRCAPRWCRRSPSHTTCGCRRPRPRCGPMTSLTSWHGSPPACTTTRWTH